MTEGNNAFFFNALNAWHDKFFEKKKWNSLLINLFIKLNVRLKSI